MISIARLEERNALMIDSLTSDQLLTAISKPKIVVRIERLGYIFLAIRSSI